MPRRNHPSNHVLLRLQREDRGALVYVLPRRIFYAVTVAVGLLAITAMSVAEKLFFMEEEDDEDRRSDEKDEGDGKSDTMVYVICAIYVIVAVVGCFTGEITVN